MPVILGLDGSVETTGRGIRKYDEDGNIVTVKIPRKRHGKKKSSKKSSKKVVKDKRGFVRVNDDKLKLTVLCRHKGETKYGYVPKKLSPEAAAERKKNLTLGRAHYAIHILDKLGVPHPNLDKMIA